MDSFSSRGSSDEYRTQLLKRALEEKRKLGLDSPQASMKSSSALQALRCYGIDSGDPSFDEVEKTSSHSRTSERRKTIDLYPKQTGRTSSYGKQLPSSNLCHADSKKDNKPLKSILKRTDNTVGTSDTKKQHSPYISAIDTPFFLDNAENEDEFLYGKSINEQSVRVSALYADSKCGSKKYNSIIDLGAQNSKKAMLDNRDKTSVTGRSSLNFKSFSIASGKSSTIDSVRRNSKSYVNTPVEKSKPSVSAANKTKSKMDLFVEDSKTFKPFPGSSKTNCKVEETTAWNFKSSNLSYLNTPAEKSKPSVSAANTTKSKVDLFVGDSKTSKTLPGTNKSKCKVDNIDARNFKSSNLFGYASLLNFSKGETKNDQPKIKHEDSGSSRKSVSGCDKKQSKPAALNNSVSSNPSDKKTQMIKSNADSPSLGPNPPAFRSKPVAQLLPRSIQQLQCKKEPVDLITKSKNDCYKTNENKNNCSKANESKNNCSKTNESKNNCSKTNESENNCSKSNESKNNCSKTNVQKPSLKDSPCDSTNTTLSKNSQNCANRPNPKGKTLFTKDEIMLFQYARKRRRPSNINIAATGEKVEPGPVAKPMTNVIIPEPRLILNSPVKKNECFSFENTKVSPASKSVSNSKRPVDTFTLAQAKASQELLKVKEEVNPQLGRKEFLLKLSSIKKKRNNIPFFNQGKRYLQKEFFPKRSFRKRGSFFNSGKKPFHTAKSKEFSEDFNSIRKKYEDSNQGNYIKNFYDLSSGSEVYGDKNFRSFDNFDIENDIGDGSVVHDSAKVSVHRKSGKTVIDFDSDRNISSKNVKQYDNVQSPGRLCTGRNMWCDNNERHGSRGVLLPERHLSYKSHSRDDFDPTPDGYAFDNSPRHSLDWSPSRNMFGSGTRKHSLDRSPGRYSFDGSPNRPMLDRSPGRQPFDESPEIDRFDRSCSPHSYRGSPDCYSYDKNPGHHSCDRTDAQVYDQSFDHSYDEYHDSHPYDGSPDRRSYDKSCDSLQYNRSPVPFSYDRSPYLDPYDAKSLSPRSQDMSPDSHPYNKNSSNHSYNEDPHCGSRSISSGRCSQEMSPRRYPFDTRQRPYSHDGSPERLSYDMSRRSGKRGPRRLPVDMSVRRVSLDRSPRRLSLDRSPRRLSLDRSPRRLSLDRSPRRFSNDLSPGRPSPGGSSRQFSDDRYSGRPSIGLKPRKWSSDRQSKSNSCEKSPGKFRKSRIDSYYDSPSRRHSRNPHKKPPKTLKHRTHSRSPEGVFVDSCDRFSERSGKSARSDLSQSLNTQVPPNCQSLDVTNNTFGEEHNKKPAPFSVDDIPKPDFLNILDPELAIPNVKKIVNAIDNLASNYAKVAESKDAHASSQSSNLQHLNSSLPAPNTQDSSQLSATSVTYPALYENFNQVNNNIPQFGYNTEIPQASFPPYNSTAAPPYPSQYSSAFQAQPLLYPTSQTITSSVATPSLYSSTTIQTPFNNAVGAATTFSSVNTALTSFNDASAASTVYCDVNSVPPPLDGNDFVQPPFSAVNAEMFPADQSDYFASDSSLERVSTLTAIPLESHVMSDDKLLRKKDNLHSNKGAVTMKFITPDKIEKLLRRKSDIRKQMLSLKNEFEKLQKMQGDAMRRKRREKDGHKDLLLLEYSKMQEEIKNHIRNFIDDVKGIEQELEDGFMGCTSEKGDKKDSSTMKDSSEKESEKSGEGSSETELKKFYDFYDSGSHWCMHCNIMCTTMNSMLEHLKSDEHAECTNSADKPWATKPTSDDSTEESIQQGEKISQPIKGVEFVMPIEGFYCSLCKEFYEKTSYMQQHLRSSRHFESYQCYIAENSSYERQWLLDRIGRLSVVEIQDRKTQSGDQNHHKRRKKEREEKLRQKQGEEEEEEKHRMKKMQDEEIGERHSENEEDRERLKEKLEDARRLRGKDDDVRRLREKEEHARRIREKEEHAKRLREKEEQTKKLKEREDAQRLKEKEEHAKRLREKEKQFYPKEMDGMNARARWKHRKEVEKKRHNIDEEELAENDKNSNHRTKVGDQMIHGLGERENIKCCEDQIKHRVAEEKTWKVTDAKQEELKRKQCEENNVPKKKLKIMSDDEDDGQIFERAVGDRAAKDQPSEKQSKTETKLKLHDKKKELSDTKATEVKFKPRQTVVYIGRAPNFKLSNKGISSFRANLLKLAVEKKEAESGMCKENDYQMTSGSVASCVESKSLSTSTSEFRTPSSSEQVLLQGTDTNKSTSDGNSNTSTVSGPCSEEKQNPPSQVSDVHSTLVEGNCNGNTNAMSNVLSSQHAGSSNTTGSLHQNLVTYPILQQHSSSASSKTSVTNVVSNTVSSYSSYDGNAVIFGAHTVSPATPATSITYSTASAFTSAAPMTTAMHSTVNADFGKALTSLNTTKNPTGVPGNTCYSAAGCNSHDLQQANVPENGFPVAQVNSHASCTFAEGMSSTPVVDCHSQFKTGKEKLCHQKKARKQVHGPLTEEDEDLLLLGINKEDQVPLVLPKPPPVSLIWSCNKEEKDVSGGAPGSEIPPVAQDSNSPTVQQCQSSTHNVGSSQNAMHDASSLQSATHDAGSSQQYGMCSSSDTSTVSSSTVQNAPSKDGNATAHQNYNYVNASAVQPQNITYSTAAQANLGNMYDPHNCTNTSSVQQSYTYPYNSSMESLNNFQSTFMMPNQPVNNVGPYPVPQVSPPGQFQSAPPPMTYGYQGPPPCRDYFNPHQQNVRFGAFPHTQFPSPNMQSANNYSPPRFRRGFGPHAQMHRPMKKWNKNMPAGVSNKEWPVNKKPSSLKVDKQESDMKASKELLSSETTNMQTCTSDGTAGTVTPAGSAAKNEVPSEEVGGVVGCNTECASSSANEQLTGKSDQSLAVPNAGDRVIQEGVSGYNTECASSSTNEQIQAPEKNDCNLPVTDAGDHIIQEDISREKQPSSLEIGGNSESIEGKACL